MLVEITLILVTVALLLTVYWKKSTSYWKVRGVPYISAKFPFGNIKDLIYMTKTIGEVYDEIYWEFKGKPFGGLYRFWNPALMLRDPEMIKKVFVKEFNSFNGNDYYVDPKVDPILGLNPFNLTGQSWIKARQIVTPSLTPAKIKTMVPQIIKNCQELIQFLKQETDFVEGYDLIGKYTTDVVAACAFGIENNSFKNQDSELRRMSKVNEYFVGIVKAASDYRIKNNFKRNDYLQSLINTNIEAVKNGDPEVYNYQEMSAHCMTFFLDGFETTSILLSFIIYELSLNSEVQKHLRNEIIKKGSKLEDFDFDNLHSIEYLEMTAMETLRKHPPGTSMSRLCNENVVLETENGKVLVEKGTPVILPMYSLHNDPEHFPEPEKFEPLRFTKENKELRPEFCHFPFGGGPRSCPGYKFALTMIKMAVVAVLLQFDLEPKDLSNKKLELNPMNTFWHSAKNGLWVKYNPRKQNL